MNLSLITIGITTYNAEATLNRAIESALSQSWKNIDIIIVDDGSNDKTWTLLKDVRVKNPQIKLFQNTTNAGVAVSRNRIIKEAKGEFIVFFDDDDTSTAKRIEKQYKRITDYEKKYAHGDPVICHSSRLQVFPNGEKHIEQTMGIDESIIAPHGIAIAERILTGRPTPNGHGSAATCSQMARTSTYRHMGGFDTGFFRSEDTEFNIRLALQGGHFVGIADPLVTQTMSISSDKSIQGEKKYALKILEKHNDFIQSISSYNACYDWIIGKYDYLAGFKFLFLKRLVLLFFRHPVFVLQRLLWALPNISLNKRFSKLYAK